MFSDNPILGVKETTIDNKGRVILPKFTFAEKADELEITRNLKTGILEIYSLNSLLTRLKQIETSLISSKSQQEKEYLESQIQRILASCIDSAKVDSQSRILIPSQVRNEYGFEDKVVIHGGYDHVKVFKTKQDYEEYVRTL
ncbi:MAG: hypothetical protein IJ966_00140 [Bacilli bacterium]|nr:hypothetical protein [Bacilli bacterium]